MVTEVTTPPRLLVAVSPCPLVMISSSTLTPGAAPPDAASRSAARNLQPAMVLREFRTSIMGYYIGIAGVQQGPFELNELVAKGLRADSLVWTDGMTDWKTAREVPEVAALLIPVEQEIVAPVPFPVQVPVAPSQPQAPLQYHTPLMSDQPSGMAIASLVLGIASYPLFCAVGVVGIIASILAVVFGFIARGRVKRGEGSGRGMALAGIILGLIPLVIFVVFCVGALIFVLAFGSKGRW